MLTLRTSLHLNDEEVAAKVLDGEAIMINLSNGNYYSMDKVGGFLWELVEEKRTLGYMVAALQSRYDVSAEQAQADVEQLAAELVRENLVKLSGDGAPLRENQLEASQQKLPYEPPTLNAYRDMADLLALDPPMPGFGEIAWKEPDEELIP